MSREVKRGPKHKLSRFDVLRIKLSYARGAWMKDLANVHEVSIQTISKAVHGVYR